MALRLDQRYPGRSTAADANYPGGSFKNESTTGADDGTPLEIDWANDKEGFFQGLLARAGVVGNDTVDTSLVAQYLNALDGLVPSGPRPPQVTPQKLCSGMPEDQWKDPAAAPNYLSTGVTIRNSCLGWDHSAGKPVLYAVYSTASVSTITGMWDYSGAPVLSSPLPLTYPTTPFRVCALCSDADFLYVAFTVSGGNLHITKYSLTQFTGAYINTYDTGITGYTFYEDEVKLIAASDTTIAVYIPSPNPPQIGILQKDFSSFAVGTGNAGGSYINELTSSRIVSDGTDVFFIVYDTGVGIRNYYLASASIANPATSSQSLATIETAVTDTLWYEFPSGLANIGGNITMSTPEGKVYIFLSGTAIVREFFNIGGGFLYSFVGGGNYGSVIGFDGLNMWLFLVDERPGAGDLGGTYCLYRIPAGIVDQYALKASMPETLAPDAIKAASGATPTLKNFGELLFDGRDMWLVGNDGDVFRYANIGVR